MEETNFKEFFGGKVPKSFIFEDEQCVVFDEERRPQAPIHFVVVPRKIIPRLAYVAEDEERLLGHLLNVARRIAKQKGLNDSGFRVVVNDGPHACQAVNQLHVQVFGGRQMGHMLLVAKDMALQRGLDRNGYHVILDEDHKLVRLRAIHVFGRALHHMLWPVGPGAKL